MPTKKPARPAPPLEHREAVERALAISGLSEDELARRLTLAPATVRRVLKGYQPIRAASLRVLREIISAGNASDQTIGERDLMRMRAFVDYLTANTDLLPKLKTLLDEQDLR